MDENTKSFLNFLISLWSKRNPKPDKILTVPNFYKDREGNRAAVYNISEDSIAAFELALCSFLLNDDETAKKSITFLTSWANTNRGSGNKEGQIYLVYKGHLFLEAFDLIQDKMDVVEKEMFLRWIKNVYINESDSKRKKFFSNNHNSWGWLGFIHSKVILNESIINHHRDLVDFIISQIDQTTGKLKKEILRTNSGMWYSYFSLAPLVRIAMLYEKHAGLNVFKFLKSGLEWYSHYVKKPEEWNYICPGTTSNNFLAKIIGRIWKIFYPCTSEIQYPKPNGWPANLFETLITYKKFPELLNFSEEEINDWIIRPINIGNIFRCSTILWSLNKNIY